MHVAPCIELLAGSGRGKIALIPGRRRRLGVGTQRGAALQEVNSKEMCPGQLHFRRVGRGQVEACRCWYRLRKASRGYSRVTNLRKSSAVY